MLQRYRAIEFRRELKSGSTGPCLFACEPEAGGELCEFVVKFRSTVRANGLAFEWLAFRLARALDVPIPDAALIIVDEETCAGVPRWEPGVAARAQQNLGLNFGSRHLGPGFNEWVKGSAVPERLRQVATAVVAFDALIENMDRGPGKTNLLWKGDEMYTFDHEVAFAFVYAIGAAPSTDAAGGVPGLAHQVARWVDRMGFLRNHALHASLRGRDDLDLASFTRGLEQLPTQALVDACAEIPEEFGRGHLDRIAAHVLRAREEATAFSEAVLRVLR